MAAKSEPVLSMALRMVSNLRATAMMPAYGFSSRLQTGAERGETRVVPRGLQRRDIEQRLGTGRPPPMVRTPRR